MWREGEEKGGKERNREEERKGILRITQIGDSVSAMEEKKTPL